MNNKITSKLLTCLFMCACVCADAQYNKTFYNTQNTWGHINESGIDVVDAGNGHTCTLSGNMSDAPDFTLRELDFTGSVVASQTFSIIDGTVRPCKLLRTANGDYLVAGYYFNATRSLTDPFIARFTPTGTSFSCIWFQEYLSNNSGLSMPTGLGQANIVLAPDALNESYIAIFTGDNSPSFPTYDKTINALRIDASGATIWNYKYDDATITQSREFYPRALIAGVDDKGTKYYIAGFCDYNITADYSFDMTIDLNGNIVDNKREYIVPAYPFGHSVLYDAATKQFVLAYTMGANYLPGGIVVSEIAVTKMDVKTLAIASTDYYYENDPLAQVSENYTNGIMMDAAGNNYVLSCWNMNRNSNYRNTTILKIDKMANIQFFKRYNKLTDTYHGAIADVVDPVTSMENYAEIETSGYLTANDMRIFTTNTLGVTCGDENIHPGQGTYKLQPSLVPAAKVLVFGDKPISYNSGESYNDSSCNASDPEYKTTTIQIMASDKHINVYPTVLSDGNNNMIIDINSKTAAAVQVSLCGIDGKELKRTIYHANAGANSFVLDTQLDLPGLYMIKIYSADNKINNIVRITKL